MRKYGIENFKISLIEETDNPEEREIYWIKQFDSYKNGYNATLGGDGKKYIDYDLVVDTYLKTKNQKMTANILNIDSHTVHNIIVQKQIPIFKNTSKCKPVNCYSKDFVYIKSFSSCGEAARELIKKEITSATIPTVASKISDCARHKRKSAYNFIWEYQ